MVKYIRYGNPHEGIPMYVISRYRTYHGYWKVEISPCDNRGVAISDPVEWDIFCSWWDAMLYTRKLYKEFTHYCNNRV